MQCLGKHLLEVIEHAGDADHAFEETRQRDLSKGIELIFFSFCTIIHSLSRTCIFCVLLISLTRTTHDRCDDAIAYHEEALSIVVQITNRLIEQRMEITTNHQRAIENVHVT